MKTCYIFGAAEGFPQKFVRKAEDLLIAADGGFSMLQAMKITPDIVLGDFDSLGHEPNFNGKIIKHPIRKDDTDTMLAVKTGLEMGFKRFVLYGCTGKRLDHTIANIQTLCYISSHGGRGYLCGDGFTATAIKDGSLGFKTTANGTVSVFSNETNTTGVDLKGLLFPLNNAEMNFDFPLGVSNEFIGERAEISVKRGTVTVIWSGDLSDLENF